MWEASVGPEDVLEGMRAFMGRIRWQFDRARAVKRYADTVRLSSFHGRNTRCITPFEGREALEALGDFHVLTAFADGALRRTAKGGIEAEPADCGRLYGFQRDGRFVPAFVRAAGPLRPGETWPVRGQSGRPLFHAPRSFLP